MSSSRVSIGGLLACALVGLNLLMANPAQANVTLTENCTALNPDESLTLFVGQQLTIIAGPACTRLIFNTHGTGPVTFTIAGTTTVYPTGRQDRTNLTGEEVTVVYTATTVSDVINPAHFNISNGELFGDRKGTTRDFTVLAAPEPDPAPDSNPSDADEGPAPLIQQFGKPDVGSCEDVAPPDLNWAGVASGGWSESWAQWMHDGNGGAVCTRTLEYHQGHSRWMVN